MSGGHSSSHQTQGGQVYNAPVVNGGSITQGNVGVYNGPQGSSNSATGGSGSFSFSMPMPALMNLGSNYPNPPFQYTVPRRPVIALLI